MLGTENEEFLYCVLFARYYEGNQIKIIIWAGYEKIHGQFLTSNDNQFLKCFAHCSEFKKKKKLAESSVICSSDDVVYLLKRRRVLSSGEMRLIPSEAHSVMFILEMAGEREML